MTPAWNCFKTASVRTASFWVSGSRQIVSAERMAPRVSPMASRQRRMTSSQPSPRWSAMRPTLRTSPASLDFRDSPDGGQ